MARFKRSLLSQLIAFLTIVSFLSLEVSCLYARQVFNQRYGIIEHEQSSEVNSEEMEIAFVIPEAGGPVYHPVPSYPIQLLKEEREELNSVVTGFKEAGQDISQIVSFFQGSNSLQDIVVSLCRNGFDVVDIAFALGDMGCSKEEVENVLPVKISSWGDKKSILVGITTGDSSFIYYSTATPLPDMSSSGIANTRLPEPLQIDAKYALDMSAQIPDGNPDQINPDKLSCSDELKRLQSEGKIGVNTAILLLESGYTLSEIVYAYVDMALDWAGGKTVELVNCAAFALADVLGIPTQKRGDIDLENLAADIIYNDILMQGEVWIKDGKIQSSMAAIQKTASSCGIDLNAYQVDTDAFFASRTKPVIIHLKQGHWVVLKSVYGDKATIISDGKKVQMSLSGLKEMFSGYVLTQENIENAKQLNITDTQQIRGSGWGKKFKKWRSEMSDKLKSFASSSFGKVIMSIAAVALAFATAGTLSPMFSSVFGEIMGAAIADGIGAFTSTFAIGSASGMKTKDALKAAIIAGVTAGVASYAANKASAAKAAKTTQAAETAAQRTAADAVQETVQKQAAQETVKETANQVSKDTIKQLTSDTAKKKITAYAIQEAFTASGGTNPYANVIASALTGGANAVIDGKSVVESVVKSAAAQGLNETAGTNEWNSQVHKLANVAVNSATDSVLDDKDSSWVDGVKDAFKATVDDVKNDVKGKIDTIKKSAEKVYEVTNQGMEFFKEAGEKVNDAKNSWLDTAKNGIENFISEAGDKIKQAKPGDLLNFPLIKESVSIVSPLLENRKESVFLKVLEAVSDKYDIKGQFLEGTNLYMPKTRTGTDGLAAYIDPDLNYMKSPTTPLSNVFDWMGAGINAKKRWDNALEDAAAHYLVLLAKGEAIGYSISGVNDDGAMLHALTKALAEEVGVTFTITHSAGSEALLKTKVTTDKVMLISPQVSRAELEAWIDKVGLAPEDVIIVDVKGDLPFAPGAVDYIGAGVKNRGDLAGVISDILSNNAYNDYSSNPNGKYTYVRIEESGKGNKYKLSNNGEKNHVLPIEAALNKNDVFKVTINGALKRQTSLENLYIDLLKGNF